MQMRDERAAVVREVRIAARPETVFSFFTDTAKITRWKGTRATLDPRPGGLFWVDVNGRDIVRGEFLEVVPFSRVVFTWGWEREEIGLRPGSTTVEVTLVPDGEGTIVRLLHHGLPDTHREFHAQGWDHFLPRLVIAAEGRDPGPDPWASSSNGMEAQSA